MSAAAGAAVFSAAELGRSLRVPDAGESFSPMGGPGWLAIDLESSSREEAAPWLAPILAEIPRLPCVTIAVGPSEGATLASRLERGEPPTGPGLADIASACDVHLADAGELDAFRMGFEKTPIAALAFVQLLRQLGSPMAVAQGLSAESFV